MNIDKNTKLDREHGWSPGVFMDFKEINALVGWLVAHRCRLGCDTDYIIKQSSASGIGTNTVIQCSCGEGKDVTNYGAW